MYYAIFNICDSNTSSPSKRKVNMNIKANSRDAFKIGMEITFQYETIVWSNSAIVLYETINYLTEVEMVLFY